MAVAERGVGMGRVVWKCLQLSHRAVAADDWCMHGEWQWAGRVRLHAWSEVKRAGRVRAGQACCSVQAAETGWRVVCCGRNKYSVSDEEEEMAAFVQTVMKRSLLSVFSALFFLLSIS